MDHGVVDNMTESTKEIIYTSVPISPELLRRSFTEDVKYLIDVGASKLPPARTLFYVSNLNIEHELELTDPVVTGEILATYMSTSLLYPSVPLEALATLVVLRFMDVDVVSEDYSRETLDAYVRLVGEDILTLWRIRLSCLEAWSLYVHKETSALAEQYPVDTITYKDGRLRADGMNFIHVLASPLMDLIIPFIRREDIYFNKELFEADMFGARNMFYYCGGPDNPYLLALFDLFNKESDDVPSN